MNTHKILKFAEQIGSEELALCVVDAGNATSDHLLDSACEQGWVRAAKKAIKLGANIHNIKDYPLQAAACRGFIDIVQLLIEKGAEPSADNALALEWACDGDKVETAELLMSYLSLEDIKSVLDRIDNDTAACSLLYMEIHKRQEGV